MNEVRVGKSRFGWKVEELEAALAGRCCRGRWWRSWRPRVELVSARLEGGAGGGRPAGRMPKLAPLREKPKPAPLVRPRQRRPLIVESERVPLSPVWGGGGTSAAMPRQASAGGLPRAT